MVAQSLNVSIYQLNDKIRQIIRKQGYFQTKIVLNGTTYYYTVFKHRQVQSGGDNEFFFCLSTVSDVTAIVTAYDMRWGIACFFKHLKTNGFHLELINLRNNEAIRLSK